MRWMWAARARRGGFAHPAWHFPSPLLSLPEFPDQELRKHLDARRPWAAGRCDQMHGALRLLPAFQDHLDLARSDRVANDELRQVSDTEAGDERRHDGFAIVHPQGATGAH